MIVDVRRGHDTLRAEEEEEEISMFMMVYWGLSFRKMLKEAHVSSKYNTQTTTHPVLDTKNRLQVEKYQCCPPSDPFS